MKVIVLNSAAQVGEEVGKIFCDEVNAKHTNILTANRIKFFIFILLYLLYSIQVM